MIEHDNEMVSSGEVFWNSLFVTSSWIFLGFSFSLWAFWDYLYPRFVLPLQQLGILFSGFYGFFFLLAGWAAFFVRTDGCMIPLSPTYAIVWSSFELIFF
jgi:hypothetical protein